MSAHKRQSLRAVVFGATGLVGQEVLQQLVRDPDIVKIHVVGRRETEISSPKIQSHISDLENPKQILNVPADFALCCLGTTMAKAKSKKAFYHVDHDLVLNAARACVAVGIPAFGFVSSVGASDNAWSYYLSVKAKTENDLRQMRFERLVIVRPCLLLGDRPEKRPVEKFFQKIDPYLSPFFIGPLKRYRCVHASKVAHHLIQKTLIPEAGKVVVENEMLFS